MNGKIIQSPNNYTYIEYDDGTTNIDGLKIEIDNDMTNLVRNKGGLMYDMFEPVLNDDVHTIYVLYADTPIRGEIVAIYFESPLEYKNNITMSGGFMKYLLETLSEENISYQIINSLDTAINNPDFKINFINDHYTNPTSINGIGVFLDDHELKHGDSLISLNKDHASRALEHISTIDESYKQLTERTYSKIEMNIRKPHIIGWNVEYILYDHNDEPITYSHTYCAEEIGHMPSDEEYATYKEQIKIDIIHKNAISLNEKFNSLADRNRLDDSQIKYQYERIGERIDYEINDEIGSTFGVFSDYYFLKDLFDKEINFKFKN